MSVVRATQTFHHEGGTVVGGTEFDSADPVARAFAPLFEAVTATEPATEPARRGPGRPPGSRNKPKDEPTDVED